MYILIYFFRKAKCLLALKQNKSALDILKETVVALDDAKLPLDRRMKWQKDIQIMIAMMTKNQVKDCKIFNITYMHVFIILNIISYLILQ